MQTVEHLSLLIKPASGLCNLHCDYCFYHDEIANRTENHSKFMSLNTLETIVKKALASCTTTCSFMFQGGEPTLVGLDFYKKLIEFQHQYNVNHVTIYNSIQTNGWSLDKDFLAFFKTNDFLVGLSIDGPEQIHNCYRHTHNQQDTFSKVLDVLHQLQINQIAYSVLSVITQHSAAYASELYNFLVKENISSFQFIPCLDPLNINSELKNSTISFTTKEHDSISPQEQTKPTQGVPKKLTQRNKASLPKLENLPTLQADAFGKFMVDFFNAWFTELTQSNLQNYRAIRHFENYMAILLGMPPVACNMTGRCALQYVIESDGQIYPCDFFVLDQYKLGNIKDVDLLSLLKHPEVGNFIKRSQINDSQCLKCKYLVLCRGGCYRDRLNHHNHNRYCSSFIYFFDHCLDRLNWVAHQLNH